MTMLADDPAITDLAPLRFVRSITAPLSPLQARRFHDKFGIAVLNSYGQTEIGGEIVGWNAADSREHGDDKLGVGRSTARRGVDPGRRRRRHRRRADEPGELWVRTPALSAGYADGSDLADRLTADGWFRTGDVGRIDDDGFVWIEGRVSSMINRGGLKVYPGEVEEVLRLAPDGRRRRRGRRARRPPRRGAVGLRRAPRPARPARRRRARGDLCREHLAPYKVPVRFEAIDELPRNEVGKVLARPLVEQIGTSA